MANGARPASGRSEWRRGWPSVVACLAGTSAGLQMFTYLGSLFVKPLAATFGWGRGEIAAGSGALLVCALAMPLAGLLADRRGVRTPAAIGVTAFALAYLGLASMTGPIWQYFAVLGLIALVGGPGTNYFLFARPIVAAFDRSRGFALSVSLCGVPVISLLLLPLLQHIIVVAGWRAAYLTLALLSLVLGAAAVLLLGKVRVLAAPARTDPGAGGVAFGQAVGDPRFWLLMLAAACVCLPTGFYVSSVLPMLTDKGVAPGTAALLGSWYALAAIAGRLTVGRLLDRLPPAWVGGLVLGAPALALSIFLLSNGPPVAPFVVGVGLFAVANGAEADVVCFLAARYFGLRANGRLNGLLGGMSAIAIAVGGMASGLIYDRMGSYDVALLAGAAASLAAALAVVASGWGAERVTAAA